MRSPAPLLRSALAGAVAVVLLTACGGSGDEEPAAASSTPAPATSSPAPSSATAAPDPAAEEFCAESQALLDDLGSAFSDQSDPTSVETAFSQAAEGFRSVEPPAEIEQDWTTLADGLDEYAAAFAELDQSDPESVSAFQQRTTSLQGELTGAATSVETYLNEECGIDTDAEPSASGRTAPRS